tara:strand:+ start:3706 stop:3915 length:210 start_codon:yes stop_codon:yes gene_type:complete
MSTKEKEVGNIKTEIKSLEKKLVDIQEECKHNGFIIKFDSDNILRKVCNDCEKVIGFPSDQELKDNNFL